MVFSLHICLTFISTSECLSISQSLTDLTSHHFWDNKKCNSHITVRKLRYGAHEVIFLTSDICSTGGAEQRCASHSRLFSPLTFAWHGNNRKKWQKKWSYTWKIFLTKHCLFDGGNVRGILCFTSFWKFLPMSLRISVTDFACEFWKETHTQKSFSWNKS